MDIGKVGIWTFAFDQLPNAKAQELAVDRVRDADGCPFELPLAAHQHELDPQQLVEHQPLARRPVLVGRLRHVDAPQRGAAGVLPGRVGGLRVLAGELLRLCDLIGRHLARKFDAADKRRLAAPRGSEVEPFMRDHEVGYHVPAGRIKHPELEKGVRGGRLRPQLGLFHRNVHPRHVTCPLLPLV